MNVSPVLLENSMLEALEACALEKGAYMRLGKLRKVASSTYEALHARGLIDGTETRTLTLAGVASLVQSGRVDAAKFVAGKFRTELDNILASVAVVTTSKSAAAAEPAAATEDAAS